MNTKMINENDVLKVSYPDGTYRETTVKEQLDFFSDETKEFKEKFLVNLDRHGYFVAGVAKYTVIKED